MPPIDEISSYSDSTFVLYAQQANNAKTKVKQKGGPVQTDETATVQPKNAAHALKQTLAQFAAEFGQSPARNGWGLGLFKDAFAAVAAGGDPASLKEHFLNWRSRGAGSGAPDPAVDPDSPDAADPDAAAGGDPVIDPDATAGNDHTAVDPDADPDAVAGNGTVVDPDNAGEGGPVAGLNPEMDLDPATGLDLADLLPDPEEDGENTAIAA